MMNCLGPEMLLKSKIFEKKGNLFGEKKILVFFSHDIQSD